jgi:hypothetical protein
MFCHLYVTYDISSGYQLVTSLNVLFYFPTTDDLAVDWIGDKLYIVESGARRIHEYDLHTGQMRVVVNTAPSGSPINIAVYPYPGHG